MQPPRPWPVDDLTGELDTWQIHYTPTDAQIWQLYDFLMGVLMVNPLNFPKAVQVEGSEPEYSATIPGSNIVVSFIIDRESHCLYLTRVVTR